MRVCTTPVERSGNIPLPAPSAVMHVNMQQLPMYLLYSFEYKPSVSPPWAEKCVYALHHPKRGGGGERTYPHQQSCHVIIHIIIQVPLFKQIVKYIILIDRQYLMTMFFATQTAT